jgi:hypothetical protein
MGMQIPVSVSNLSNINKTGTSAYDAAGFMWGEANDSTDWLVLHPLLSCVANNACFFIYSCQPNNIM